MDQAGRDNRLLRPHVVQCDSRPRHERVLCDSTHSHQALSNDLPIRRFADALSHGELFRMDMGLMKAANSSALQWVDVEQAPYPSGYEPVMALAQNHVFFLNVPDVSAGSASIYVIHCKSGSFPPRDRIVHMVASLQTTTSNLSHNPSQRPVVGRSLQLTERPRRSSKLKGYAASLLYSLHLGVLMSVPGARNVRIRPRRWFCDLCAERRDQPDPGPSRTEQEGRECDVLCQHHRVGPAGQPG